MAKTEAEAEIEKMKILEERINAPSIWCRLPCGLRFEDLQDVRYDEAVQLLEEHFLTEEVTYKSVNIIKNKEGTEEFLCNARIWMKDKMSIAAVNEESDELIGVLIMRIQEKSAFSRTFSRVKLTYNLLYANIMTFYNEVEKPVDLYDKLDVKKYLKIYALAVKRMYRHKGIAKEMLKSALSLAASAHVPAISGIFTACGNQRIAEELGFIKFNEIPYNKYLSDDQVLFTDTEKNHSAALMALRIAYVRETEELQTQQTSRFNIEPIDSDDTSEKKLHN
ncbi:uncharacterized protein [Battus philenor]|uniref:uncharacterized protein n=1 Tax=Battus philenor TaxID=42288 RepID=UPI0035D05798